MNEDYTHQSLPSREYRQLLGTALSVFNSNNAFIIENILRIDSSNYNWFELIDLVSGRLKSAITDTITMVSNPEIASLFGNLVERRNRIIHSFQITLKGEQILSTKDQAHNQYPITEEYLMEFIKDNDILSRKLHDLRGF